MKYIFLMTFVTLVQHCYCQNQGANKALAAFFQDYTEQSYKLNPLMATQVGDARYNDQLAIQFTDDYIEKQRTFYQSSLKGLQQFDREKLDANDKLSYDIFKYTVSRDLERLELKLNRIPFNQFRGLHNELGQFGSGKGAQPFKTVTDYENWLKRAKRFPAWADSAIVYFTRGMNENIVLPKALVIKMIPQLNALAAEDVTKSVFYGPVNNFPESFSESDKVRLTESFKALIQNHLNPAYKKLAAFIQQEYLPKSRSTSGLANTPNGTKLYEHYIRASTTTDKTPEELFNTGVSEVKRIRQEMEKVRQQVNFKGSLDSFFIYVKTDPKFLPYKTAEEILDAYRVIQKKIEPHLDKLFSLRPKTPFEIRQTEAFRAASAAAQYNAGLPDGSRPGIFYIPIIDPLKHTTAKENLFIHEAIPGHHFQVMLQKENKNLPKFRQDGGNSAYAEGWGLYAESLGKMLGCYTDPYQYFYALGDEMHRAIRLVVDVGLHSKGWSREEAIAYMRKNEPITEQSATAEIERYMAIPGQALSYKVGELKIKELRDKYSKQLGKRFRLNEFHDEILRDGAMPLTTLEEKMDRWAGKLK